MSACVGEDDTIVVAGHTDGNWAEGSAGGHGFAAMKIDNDGTILWRWQVGKRSRQSGSSRAFLQHSVMLMLPASSLFSSIVSMRGNERNTLEECVMLRTFHGTAFEHVPMCAANKKKR